MRCHTARPEPFRQNEALMQCSRSQRTFSLWQALAQRAWLAVLVVLSLPATAGAQSDGFALNRFNPAEAGSDWFAADTLDLRGKVRPSFLLLADWSHKPLVLYDEDGDEQQAIIEDQLYLHAGLSLNLYDRLRLSALMPFILVSDGTQAVVD